MNKGLKWTDIEELTQKNNLPPLSYRTFDPIRPWMQNTAVSLKGLNKQEVEVFMSDPLSFSRAFGFRMIHWFVYETRLEGPPPPFFPFKMFFLVYAHTHTCRS